MLVPQYLRFALLAVFLCLNLFCSIAQSEGRFPEGVKEAEYTFIKADGSGEVDGDRIDPPFWWVGMKNTHLELMIHSKDIGAMEVQVDYPGVKVLAVDRPSNPNYLFVQLQIGPGTQAGKLAIQMKGEKASKRFSYELHKPNPSKNRIQGISSADFIYLLLPDRFANGDSSNDDIPSMQQTGIDRDNVFFRHGGDLQGVIDHLDYLQDLGITALWLNPIFENDQPYESYHGYAPTDHYKVDPRFGTNELYLKMVDECHQRGIKVIMDVIHNHVGNQHWFIRDLPSEDWIHQWPEFTKTSYRAPTLMDPYASDSDRQIMSNGWFDRHMPDLNQQNPHVARYLIQNHLWWVEYSGQDAYRIDTYAYCDPQFTADWGQAMQTQFPQLSLFAETWVHGAAIQAQFTQNNHLREGYNSHMPAVTDFQLYYAINEALSQGQEWTEGISRIYYTLAQDFLYEDPSRNVVFLDNHDLTRFYSILKKDWNKFCSGLAFLLTTRGIPMMYYGTELLFQNMGDIPEGPFGEEGRIDFPGGWPTDTVNKFVPEGRSVEEQNAFEYVRKLANYRKNNQVLQYGKLQQFVPMEDIYVYFRYDADKTVMVLMNSGEVASKVNTKRFEERLLGFKQAKNVINETILRSLEEITVEGHSTLVLELLP